MEEITPFNPKITSKMRTAGDGMESAETVTEAGISNNNVPTSNVDPSCGLIQVFPTSITKSEKKSQFQNKSPKFVPYEPYPGAVKPMMPNLASKSVKKSKNNMDINTLITQMSQMDTNLNEYKPRPKLVSIGDKPEDKVTPQDNEMQKKVDDLSKENESLKEQLKQQVQVNKELKTMLVASMGEDLETQVNSLNEDKKHLANELLNSVQHLSTHQEQTEWLAGQCEVWRSKFLASSLMVEELANTKKLLTDKTERLQLSIKQLFDERCRVRDMMMCTYRNLYTLHEKWLEEISLSEYASNSQYSRPIGNLNFNATKPHSTNIIDMANVNLKLSENISSAVEKPDISDLDSLPTVTEGETHAESVMAMPSEIRKLNDASVSALVSHAHNKGTSKPRPVASCSHCNGQVQLL